MLADLVSRAKEGITTPIPPEQILANHSEVYRCQDAYEEDLIDDLEEYPLQNQSGEDLPIFDKDGNSIRRTVARPVPGATPAGVFLALSRAKELFRSDSFSTDRQKYVHGNNVDKYPIGHLPNVGSIQTNQPLPLFNGVVKRINNTIGQTVPYEEGEEPLYEDVDESGNLVVPTGIKRRPIFGTHTQIYNLSVHHFAPRANQFRVLHGQVTAAASSKFAVSSRDREKGKAAEEKIATHLPFEALEAQMDGADIPVSLRLEQVFVVSMDDLEDEYKTGQWVHFTNMYRDYRPLMSRSELSIWKYCKGCVQAGCKARR